MNGFVLPTDPTLSDCPNRPAVSLKVLATKLPHMHKSRRSSTLCIPIAELETLCYIVTTNSGRWVKFPIKSSEQSPFRAILFFPPCRKCPAGIDIMHYVSRDLGEAQVQRSARVEINAIYHTHRPRKAESQPAMGLGVETSSHLNEHASKRCNCRPVHPTEL